MKKIINSPESIVAQMCEGIAIAHPEMEVNGKYKIIKRKENHPEKVSLISGGGSGHEPAHAGFVGMGMLDAAVCGDVFASPSQIQVYKAIKETESEKGTLLIIKNYSGDMMNFKNAAAMAIEDGMMVDYVKVDDDIAVQDSLYTVGKRGVAGTVFVHKIAGAAAESGLELAEVKRIAEKTIQQVKSIGFAFSSCVVPAKGTPTFVLGEQEMEYGVGIHGEPGIRRESVISADELALRMVEDLLKELDIQEDFTGETAVLINGFGATPLQELYVLGNSAMKVLDNSKIKVSQMFVGNYMTSIDMAGASISILKLDAELKAYLKAPSEAPAFRVTGNELEVSYVRAEEQKREERVSFEVQTSQEHAVVSKEQLTIDNIVFLVDKMSEIIIKNEVPFCELDAHAGDGDFGMSVAKGFKELKREWDFVTRAEIKTIGAFLEECALIIMENCGGASGPIWGSAFRSAGKAAGENSVLTKAEFADVLQAAVKGIQLTGERSFGRGAVVGDKTLIDALVPCANWWSEHADKNCSTKELFREAAAAAVEGAEKTKAIVARMGRAGTVGERSIGHPDAGAYALGVIFSELADSIK